MKRKIIVVSVSFVVLLAAFFIGTGFMKNPNVVLGDYSISEDGSKVILYTGMANSMGYVRGYKNNGGGVKPHYLTFYSAFGGLNSSLGAKNAFTLELEPDDTEIYFNRADGGYELVLVKDEKTGKWGRATEINHSPEGWGVTLTAENVTPTSATIQCTQSGGEPTGQLQTGSRYVLEIWTEENDWQEAPCFAEVCWTQEALLIDRNSVTEWDIDWEWLYGKLSKGKYRIAKDITDFRDTGDYDTATYYAEFEIAE